METTQKTIREIKALAKQYGFGYLLSVDSDPKTAKSNKAGVGYFTAIVYLAPAMESGYQVCASAKECIVGCLHKAGNPIYFPAKEKARIARTRFFFEHRAEFYALLRHEIQAFVRKCNRLGLSPAIRLNGTSDIVWERVAPWLFDEFADVTFYDYTKHVKRLRSEWRMPSNYSLTFSRQASNEGEIASIIQAFGNVAVVFRSKALPQFWHGIPVINGDKTDLRFLDPKGVIVGLSAKGPAKKDTSGFVVESVESY
jgi:hypothetical protein